MEPIGTLKGINITEPGAEVADEELGILTAAKIVSLRFEEIVSIGAEYQRLYEAYKDVAVRYRDGITLCAESLREKGITENYTTAEGAQVKFKRYAKFSKN